MKKLIISLVVLLVVSTTNFSQEHSSNTPPTANNSKDGWLSYTSPEGRYSVSLPTQPKLESQQASNDEGLKFTQFMATSMSKKAVHMIGYFDLGENVDYNLDKGRDGLVSGVKGTLVSESAISLGGYPGRAVRVSAKAGDGEDFVSQARIYLVKNRVYVVQFLSLSVNTNEPEVVEAAKKYFDSFSITVP